MAEILVRLNLDPSPKVLGPTFSTCHAAIFDAKGLQDF